MGAGTYPMADAAPRLPAARSPDRAQLHKLQALWCGRVTLPLGAHDQLGRPVTLDEREQGRCMRWWAGCFIRGLRPLTVEAPGVWHMCHEPPDGAGSGGGPRAAPRP